DLARAMESYLSSPANFTYDSDVRDDMRAGCGGTISSTECFAIIKKGYCEFYATAMTVMLRQSGIPARVAYGFLPGKRGSDNLEVVSAASAHWWVEVYFPNSGWVEFEPTGQVGQPQPIPSGSVGPPTARPSQLSATFRDDRGSSPPPTTGLGRSSGIGGVGPAGATRRAPRHRAEALADGLRIRRRARRRDTRGAGRADDARAREGRGRVRPSRPRCRPAAADRRGVPPPSPRAHRPDRAARHPASPALIHPEVLAGESAPGL